MTVPESAVVESIEAGMAFVDGLGAPVVVRPAFTLGGGGGGFAADRGEARAAIARGLAASPIGQVLVERSLLGWAEIEFEVIRDSADTTIAICGMENLDPMGVHTGDSIVVAPIQTLPDVVVQRLRRSALAIARALKLEGGCNVQLAVAPDGSDYRVIEVNPRVSRSSALASKATGYPIARVAALVALGMRLDEMRNPATGGGSAAFEPAVDYVVVKLPRWPFDKFPSADRSLGVQMKATGEAMAIDREFGSALLKAIRSLEPRGRGWLWEDPAWRLADGPPDDLEAFLAPSDTRLWRMVGLLRQGLSDAATIARVTGVRSTGCRATETRSSWSGATGGSARYATRAPSRRSARPRITVPDGPSVSAGQVGRGTNPVTRITRAAWTKLRAAWAIAPGTTSRPIPRPPTSSAHRASTGSRTGGMAHQA